MITKPKNKKVLVGIVAAAVLLLGLIFGGITLAGNSPAGRADKYLNLGDKYLSELNYEQALVAYQQVLEIEPKNLDAYKGGLSAYAGLGNQDGMVEFYNDALGVIESMTEQELRPVHDTALEIYLYAGIVYPEDHEAAAQALERGYNTLGGDESLIRALIAEYGILAGMYIDAGDYDKEQDIYRRIVEKNLENSDTLSGWEQHVRERFQEYLSKNGGGGDVPGATVDATLDPATELRPEPTSEPTIESTSELTPEPIAEPTAEPAPESTPKPTPASVALQGNIKDSGEYMGLSWQVTDAGELVVTGYMEEGRFASWDVWYGAPWRQYRNETVVAYMSFTGAENLNYLFAKSADESDSALVEVNLSGLDTSNVINMRYMFWGCSSLVKVDLGGLDMSSVIWMDDMFRECSSLKSIDLSSLDTSSVVDMSNMFLGCSNLSSVNLSGIDTSNVILMEGMFSGCSSLGSVDLSGIDTGNVTDMNHMFSGCSSLISVDLNGIDTSSVLHMNHMFSGCSSLGSVDLSSIDTSSVMIMSDMFSGCSSLIRVDISGFDSSSLEHSWEFLFYGCDKLQEILVGERWSDSLEFITGMNRDGYVTVTATYK